MSQNITARLNGVVKAKLKSVAVGQPHDFDVSACFAPTMDQNGNLTGLTHSWLVTVSIPNPLQGRPDIAVSVPVNGVVPPPAVFEDVAEALFEKVMQQKTKVLSPPPQPVPPITPAEAADGNVVRTVEAKPAAPRRKRERTESFFPSKPGSGDFAA